MAILETSRPTPLSAIAAFRVVQFFEAHLETLRTWNKARKTDRDLRTLSDRMLNDIGLNRGDIETVSFQMSIR